MRRYALFCFSTYYPQGGWEDFKGSFDSEQEAIKKGLGFEPASFYGGWHVVDLQSGTIVAEGCLPEGSDGTVGSA